MSDAISVKLLPAPTPSAQPAEVAPVPASPAVPGMQQNATPCYSEKNPAAGDAPKSRPGEELTQQQRNAIELLLQGLSDAQVAARIGVDRTTVFRWRKKQAFRRDLERERRLLWRQATKRLQTLVTPALDILHEELAGDDPRTKLRAASILLRVATPARLERMTGKALS
jgi:hypothetical protein